MVSCHPLEESYTAHLRDEALAALPASHEVRHRDLYAELVTVNERSIPDERGAPEHLAHESDLAWAEGLVLIYPTWWSSMPAPLVQWLDDCLSARENYPYLRHITVVTTHGSSWLVNLVEGEVGRRVVLRGLRGHAAPRCSKQWIAMYNIDRSTPRQRQQFVARVRRKLAAIR